MTQAEQTPNVRQQPNEVVDNSIKLKREGAKQVIDALNSDVASLFVLFHQYQKHHWVAEGPQFRDLHILLEEHYTATQLQADAFAERIVTLGGVPVSGPTAQLERGYVTEEPEGILDLRQMLSNDVKANQQILVKLREHIGLSRQLGDFGSETLIKRHLREQELRTQDLMHMLEHETLDEILAQQ
ncbi:MAG: DNA starvation/stationary phase protection protein [Chloroflexi bacterium]|nr:MAG: DNA starvation/stationary phase protection protein [Chloroflexota bacterium]